MKVIRHALPLLLVTAALQAGDLDLYLTGNNLSFGSDTRNGTIDPTTGNRLGSTVLRGGDLRQLGLGAAWTLLSPGALRVRVGLEASTTLGNMPMSLRYLGYQGLTEYSAQTDGQVTATTITPLVSLVYVSTGAGEYGLSYEQHFQDLSYKIANNVVVDGETIPPNTPMKLTKAVSDPFLTVHATFVQRYRTCGFFAQVRYGVNLATPKKLADLSPGDFLGTTQNLMDLCRPRQELKLALGTRF